MQAITKDQALTLVKQFWHIEGDAKELPSYADRNFKITNATGSYVFKIANPNWSHADLDIENAALRHLEKTCPELALPKVILTENGLHILPLSVAGDQICHLRLLSYVEGEVYAKLAPTSLPTGLPASLGRALGLLHRGLAEFKHPSMDRYVDWSISNLPALEDEIPHIEPSKLREIVQRHSRYFADHEPAWRQTLPIMVIHNDANDFNIIVSNDGHGDLPQVNAIIDFGDMCRHFRVLDLAIAMTYALQHAAQNEKTEDDNKEAIVTCALAILNAYQSVQPLSRAELDALLPLLMARLCQSILMATKAYRKTPGNDYIMISQLGVRRLICQLDAMHHTDLQTRFLSV